MPKPTDEQIRKLPKWAQFEIHRLTANLMSAEAELERRRNNTPSHVWLQHFNGKDFDRDYRDDDQTFVFSVGEDQEVHVRWDKNNGVYLMGVKGLLTIRPKASNVATAHIEDY